MYKFLKNNPETFIIFFYEKPIHMQWKSNYTYNTQSLN